MLMTVSIAGCSMANENITGGPLAEFAAAAGEHHAAAGNRPIWLNDPGLVWFVETGAVDILGTELSDGRMEAPFRHVARLEPGRLVFGAAETGHSMLLVAKGVQATGLRRLPLARLLEEAARGEAHDGVAPEVLVQLDAWIKDLSAAVTAEIESHPQINGMTRPTLGASTCNQLRLTMGHPATPPTSRRRLSGGTAERNVAGSRRRAMPRPCSPSGCWSARKAAIRGCPARGGFLFTPKPVTVDAPLRCGTGGRVIRKSKEAMVHPCRIRLLGATMILPSFTHSRNEP